MNYLSNLIFSIHNPNIWSGFHDPIDCLNCSSFVVDHCVKLLLFLLFQVHFGRKLINEDFQLFCYGIPRWSVFLPNSFLVDRFFCRNVSSLIIFSAKIFPRWSLFLPKSFLIDHFFVTTSTRILTFLPFWGLKTPTKKF